MRFLEILEAIYENKKQQLKSSLCCNEQPVNEKYDNVIIDTQGNYLDNHRPRLTLRHLHKLRKHQDAVKKEKQEHLDFLPTMYANDNEQKTEFRAELAKDKLNNQAALEKEKIKQRGELEKEKLKQRAELEKEKIKQRAEIEKERLKVQGDCNSSSMDVARFKTLKETCVRIKESLNES
tara:strand:+ start:1172 stop:1708 length:537 start_codon:yes stop_codon:yes gene_type:complete